MIKSKKLRRFLAGFMCVGLLTSGLSVYADELESGSQTDVYNDSGGSDTESTEEMLQDITQEEEQSPAEELSSIEYVGESQGVDFEIPEDYRLITDMKQKDEIEERILDTTTTSVTMRKSSQKWLFGSYNMECFKYWLDEGTQVYCIQSLERGPDPGNYNFETVYNSSHMLTKAAYYGYGGPGYDWNSPIFQLIHGVGSNVDPYFFTHFIMSYIYDGAPEPYYNSGTLQLIGFTPSGASKTLAELVHEGYLALKNMPAIPGDARFAVFQGLKNGVASTVQKMGLFLWQYQPPKEGYAQVVKSSSNPGVTNGNANYTLAGAQYTVYRDANLSNVAAVLTTDANGNSNVATLEAGSYWVKETSAPKGYDLDTTVYPIQVKSTETYVLRVSDNPKFGYVDVMKSSANSAITNGNPNYTLKGAVYGVYRDRGCTQEVGRITTNSDGWGRLTGLSGGVYYIKEISASQGYELDPNVYPVDCYI